MSLEPLEYEPRLKEPLECFRCGQPAKNMPALKKHLQEEFDALRKREAGKSNKRMREVVDAEKDESASDRETTGGAAKGKGKKVARLS